MPAEQTIPRLAVSSDGRCIFLMDLKAQGVAGAPRRRFFRGRKQHGADPAPRDRRRNGIEARNRAAGAEQHERVAEDVACFLRDDQG